MSDLQCQFRTSEKPVIGLPMSELLVPQSGKPG
jgi:hypothetical protein